MRGILKEYNVTNRRTINYASLEAVAGMGARPVYKIAEICVGLTDTFQSTISSTKKLEYKIGLITHAFNDGKLLDCFDFIEGAETLMRTLKRRTDRLVILLCAGYTDGSWEVPRENKNRGWLSIKVKAIKPIRILKTYNECMKGGEKHGN